MEMKTAERYVTGGPGRDLHAQNLALAFLASVDRLGDEIALSDPERGVELSWNEVRDRSAALAGGLAKLGVKKGDTVALMLNNRWEFIPLDLGIVSLGGVPFSIYQTSSPEQISYVVDDADAKVAIVEASFLDTFNKARDDLPKIETIIVVDGDGGDLTFDELEESGQGFDITATVNDVGPDDLLTLIYTSGTTGPPKGVQLSHRNLMSLVSQGSTTSSTSRRRRRDHLLAARGSHRRARRPLLRARLQGFVDHDLPRPAPDHRVPSAGTACLVLRRPADLGEAEGRARSKDRFDARRAA